MNTEDLITIVKNEHLPRATRLDALNEILCTPAPGALKQLLSDNAVLLALTLEIHDQGTASQYIHLICKAFKLDD